MDVIFIRLLKTLINRPHFLRCKYLDAKGRRA